MALSSGNNCKYEFLIGGDVLPEKELLEKAATIKRFEIFLITQWVEKANWHIAKDQYKFFKDQINVVNNDTDDGVKI